MSRKQLLTLFVCSLIPWTIANGIAPLVPTQAAALGANQSLVGYGMSLSHLAMAVGTVSAGWLSDRLGHRRRPLIAAGLLGLPALYLMGRATTLWVLLAALAAWFLCCGLMLALASITAGLCAEGSQRGKVFGLLTLTAEMGAILGGAVAGPICDRWGYPSMYAALSLIGLVGPLAGLFIQERDTAAPARLPAARSSRTSGLGRNYHLLFAASLSAAAATFVFFLGRSLVMAEKGFSSAALSGAGAVGSAIALPFPLLVGWLSDRVGRKRFLALSFAATTAGLIVLSVSTSLWHFWAASTLFTLSFVGGPVGSALVADLVPQTSLGRGLAAYNSTTWLGGIAGCAMAGCAAQSLGVAPTLLAGACLPLLAGGFLLAVSHPARSRSESALPAAIAAPAVMPSQA